MKVIKWQFITLIVVVCMAVGVVIGQESLRFKHLVTQTDFPNDSKIVSIEVYHDTISGQEFMCVFGDDATKEGYKSVSCLPTGRNWK